MSGRISQVWRSRLPRVLKAGVAGAAEAMADDDGTYARPLTVARLVEHVYFNGGRLSSRTVQYQLRILERLGVLVVLAPTAHIGRGHPRAYRFVTAALGTMDLATVDLRPAHRRAAGDRAQQLGRNTPAADAGKGATKGATIGRNSAETPFSCTGSTSTPALRADQAVEKSDGTTTTATPGATRGARAGRSDSRHGASPRYHQLSFGPQDVTPPGVDVAALERDAAAALGTYRDRMGPDRFAAAVARHVQQAIGEVAALERRAHEAAARWPAAAHG